MCKENDTIVGAMAITLYQGSDYHNIDWKMEVKDNEVGVIHVLCVNPDIQGKGVAKRMVQSALDYGKEMGMKVFRIDALSSNKPAHKAYESVGFVYRGKQHLYADNTGWTDFFYFEYLYK